MSQAEAKKVEESVEQYKKEADLLQHVLNTAKNGDALSVLETIDKFGWETWMMNLGDVKGKQLDAVFNQQKPKVVVELGGYCGYSAVRMAHLLTILGDEESHFYSIEVNPLFVSIATKVVEHAGLSNKVTIINGAAADIVPQLKERYGIKQIDFLFIDHWKNLYLDDFKVVEGSGLLVSGSLVVADNIIYPGAPDYREYLEKHEGFKTELIMSKLEYSDKEDAVLVSKKI